MTKHYRNDGKGTVWILYFASQSIQWVYRMESVGRLVEEKRFDPQSNVEAIASKYFMERIAAYNIK